MYSEDAYISYFFKLATINRFFETALHTHGCANPSRTFFFGRIYQALMTSRPPFFNRVVRPRPRHLRIVPISLANTSTVYVRATAQLLFSSTISLQKCCEKLSKDDHYIALRGKSYCLSGVRPSERPAGLGLFSPTFHASDRSLSRCGAQTSFFLHTNSLINSSHIGDAF